MVSSLEDIFYNPVLEQQIEQTRLAAEARDSGRYKIKRRRKPTGFLSSIASLCFLSAGAVFCYVSLHYVPAFLSSTNYVDMPEVNQSATRLNTAETNSFTSHYLDFTSVKQAYLRKGQALQVQYTRPENANIELEITRCKSAFLVEVFKCESVGTRHIEIKGGAIGTHRLFFEDAGFYRLKESVRGAASGDNYRVVWSRI
jgi:hypothetical protein